MAELSDFLANTDAIRDGVWVTVGAEPNTFEIKTRGVTGEYKDNLNRMRREAAREVNKKLPPGAIMADPSNLPPTIDDRIQGQAIAKYCFLDVRGLTSAGKPVSADAFAAMLIEPEGRTLLLSYAIGAAFRVADEVKEEQEEALGNSLPA